MANTKENIEYKKTVGREGKVGKYLTDIKELPPSTKDQPPQEPLKKKEETLVAHSPLPEKPPEKEIKKVKILVASDPKVTEKEPSFFTFKDVVLGIINFISIALVIVLLTKLPEKANEFQVEKIEEIRNQVNPQAEFSNINEDKEKAAKLDALFLDETGVVHFVSDVEKLKSEGGAISKVTFASPKAVKDEMGILGIPVTIELRGSWDTIAQDLEKIQTLTYLFRPVSIESGPSKDEPNVLVLNYGVFLYVNSSKDVNQ